MGTHTLPDSAITFHNGAVYLSTLSVNVTESAETLRLESVSVNWAGKPKIRVHGIRERKDTEPHECTGHGDAVQIRTL